MKKSLLALALSMAAASGAHAGWDNGINPDLVTGNGELVLSVWDSVTQNSYTQDLGITYNQLKAGTATGVYNLNGALLSVFANTANLSTLQFSIMAASNAQYTPSFDPQLTNFGFIYSTAPGQNKVQVLDSNNYTFIDTVQSAFTTYQSALNFNQAIANPSKTVSSGGLGYANSNVWESFLESSTGRDLSASNGQFSNLWLQSFADNDGNVQLQQLLGTAKLDITSLSNGTLTISQVPVPAAAWLMGSALLGLGSVARKRKQA